MKSATDSLNQESFDSYFSRQKILRIEIRIDISRPWKIVMAKIFGGVVFEMMELGQKRDAGHFD